MLKAKLVKYFESLRYILAAIGFYLAYQPNNTSAEAIAYLVLWAVVPLAGLTGLESVFLSNETAIAKGREAGSAYQIQSGLNNLATAITAFIIWYFQWGMKASVTIIFVLYIFFILSSINHSIEYFRQENKKLIHLFRPMITLILILVSLPIIMPGF
ncbi:MAG: hypothetical protein EP298_02155 [Gammaproteobacteria bacterium]|nr:MAG: hypothetical protein EP298_02155 [Gammaproteobacteria bacterium]UTW42414.1 hypothetical protein KFE69_13180 [bacterium SCSIO 12844]